MPGRQIVHRWLLTEAASKRQRKEKASYSIEFNRGTIYGQLEHTWLKFAVFKHPQKNSAVIYEELSDVCQNTLQIVLLSLPKERVINNFPVWAVSFSTMLRCFGGHLA